MRRILILAGSLLAVLGIARLGRRHLSARRVLIVGDSLSVGPRSPGGYLAAAFEAAGAAVRVNARVGRSAASFWAQDAGSVAGDLAWAPDVVLVILGTNDTGRSEARTRDGMARLVAAYGASGAQVIAIGPPSFADATLAARAARVAAIMGGVFGDGFLDGRPASAHLTAAGRTRDGVHFTAEGAGAWAAGLADELGVA